MIFMNSADGKATSDITGNPALFYDTAPIAYVRPVATDKGSGFAVCSADGTQLAVFATRDAAYYAAKQHDLEPMDIH